MLALAGCHACCHAGPNAVLWLYEPEGEDAGVRARLRAELAAWGLDASTQLVFAERLPKVCPSYGSV